MTDKVQLIRAEIERLQKKYYQRGEESDANHDGNGMYRGGVLSCLNEIHTFIDSLPEEPVRDDFKKFEEQYLEKEKDEIICVYDRHAGLVDGAKWQKEHLWKTADGDDMPEYDREVIAILDYDFGHYKVVYAHRPNPNGWNGTNIDTGEKEYIEPVIYDKGGWNQPHVLYWLDTRLPYEENTIKKKYNYI